VIVERQEQQRLAAAGTAALSTMIAGLKQD
jgi:hypothetical protein